MTNLKERIQNQVQRVRFNKGHMGTEVTTVTFTLSEDEKQEFFDIDLEDGYNYDLGENELSVSYSEE